jgi:hypothetical protein
MVNASDFLGPDELEPDELEPDEDDLASDGEADDLVALKACLQALADAIASTNLAVINSTQGDRAGASGRVTSSVAALKRFHDAFLVLKGERPAEDEDDGEA